MLLKEKKNPLMCFMKSLPVFTYLALNRGTINFKYGADRETQARHPETRLSPKH